MRNILLFTLGFTLLETLKSEEVKLPPQVKHGQVVKAPVKPDTDIEPRVIPELITLQSSVLEARPISAEVLNKKFKAGPLEGKGQVIIDMANKHGIDPLFLASYYGFETGWGMSRLLKNRNNPAMIPERDEKGVPRYDGRRMPIFKTFNTIEEGIEAGAVYLKQIASNQPVKNPNTIESVTSYIFPEYKDTRGPGKPDHQKFLVSLMNNLAKSEANK